MGPLTYGKTRNILDKLRSICVGHGLAREAFSYAACNGKSGCSLKGRLFYNQSNKRCCGYRKHLDAVSCFLGNWA